MRWRTCFWYVTSITFDTRPRHLYCARFPSRESHLIPIVLGSAEMTWMGRKNLALVPLYRPHAHPPDQIPPDWPDQILRRVLYDPDPHTGADRSLRAYIHAASSGLA